MSIAPGSRKEHVQRAAEAAVEMISPGGRIYIVTDLGETPAAVEAIKKGLQDRGLSGRVSFGFRKVEHVAAGRNPIGIPLESDFFRGYREVWEIFVELTP